MLIRQIVAAPPGWIANLDEDPPFDTVPVAAWALVEEDSGEVSIVGVAPSPKGGSLVPLLTSDLVGYEYQG